MKKTLLILLALLVAASPVMAEEFFPPQGDSKGVIGGRQGEAWRLGIFDSLSLNGVTYTFPATDGTATQVLATDGSGTFSWANSGAATAWDDIGDPDAAGTVAFTTFAQLLTSTKTDGDMLNIQGLGAFADVSVLRVEQITGNPTDGTVLEVVAADANVDPLVVSSSAQAGALIVGQNGGTVTTNGPFVAAGAFDADGAASIGDGGDTVAIDSSDWDISATGIITGVASIGFDNGTVLQQINLQITAAEVKALRATPKTIIAAAGAGTIVEFVSAVFVLDYGSEVFTETADNLVIEYEDGRDISAAVETTGFIDQAVDQVAIINAADVPTMTAAAAVNKAVQLFNTGDGEIGGNASDDSVLNLRITYRTHTISL